MIANPSKMTASGTFLTKGMGRNISALDANPSQSEM